MRTRGNILILNLFLWIMCNQPLFSWSPLEGGDHGGQDWHLSTHTAIAGVHTNLRLFQIDPNVTVVVPRGYGALEIRADTISVHGHLSAKGSGFSGGMKGKDFGNGWANGEGPGAGRYGYWGVSGSGAGHGGNGGVGSSDEKAGSIYGTSGLVTAPPSLDDIEFGSGGGASFQGGKGGSGGGSIFLSASSVTIHQVDSSGEDGEGDWSGSGGGGSGGTLLIDADSLTVYGNVASSGGNGVAGCCQGGGGGGGGRIKVFYIYKNNFAVNVSSGAEGKNHSQPASFGTIHFDQKPLAPVPIAPIGFQSFGLLPQYNWTGSMDADGPDDDDLPGDGLPVTYEFNLSTSVSFNPLVVSARTISSQFTSTQTLDANTTYYWRVRAFDQSAYTGWNTASFVIPDLVPPSLQGIENIEITSASFTFAIAEAADEISGLHVLPYYTDLSTSSDFSSPPIASHWQKDRHESYTSLVPNTAYFLRVKARDKALNETLWISTSVKTLSAPPSKGIFGKVDSNSMEVFWNPGANPMGTTYLIQISSRNNFSSFSQSSWQEESKTIFKNLSSNTTYWTRVKSRNSAFQETDYAALEATATLAMSPPPPDLASGFDDRFNLGYFMRVFPSFGNNHPDTLLAIQNAESKEYLQGDGTTSLAPVWKTKREWESGFLTNSEGVLAPLKTFRYMVHAKNFTNLINATPSTEAIGTTPPPPAPLPTVKETGESGLSVNINYVSGAERYWVFYATSPAAPLPQYVHIGTITPLENSFVDPVVGSEPETPRVAVQSPAQGQTILRWNTPAIQPSAPRYYRVAGVDNFNRAGQKSAVALGASKVSPYVANYQIYRNNIFLTSTTFNSYTDLYIPSESPIHYSVIAISNEKKASPAAVVISTSAEQNRAAEKIDTDISKARIGPNPWNTAQTQNVTIDHIPQGAEIQIYMATGQKVAAARCESGSGIFQWNGTNDAGEPLASGVYILNIQNGGQSKKLKLTLVR